MKNCTNYVEPWYLMNISVALIAVITVCIICVGLKNAGKTTESIADAAKAPAFLPWQNVGGCGAGGSGGAASDGIKWLGMGVRGGLIDVEIMPKYSFGQNFSILSIAPRLSFMPTYTTTVGISIPFVSKRGEVQAQSNQPPNDRTTGGTGDLSIDVSRTFGMSGEYSAGLSLTIPTGQYDIKRGADNAEQFLPSILQKGGGLYSATFSLGYTYDVEDGFWMTDLSFSQPFNVRASGENEFLDSYFPDYKDSTDNSRFYYHFKPYGENDLGGYTPPSLSASLYFAYRGVEHYVHSWGIAFSAPFGVAWIPAFDANQYNPIPDPDHKAWNAALVYGLEFSRKKYPLYLAVSIPVHDKTNKPGSDIYDDSPMRKWDGPDWGDFGQQMTIGVGLKSTMF